MQDPSSESLVEPNGVGRRRFLAVLGAASVSACGAGSPVNNSDAATADTAPPRDGAVGTDVAAGDGSTDAGDAGAETDGGTCTTGNPYGPATAYAEGQYMLASSPLQIIVGRDAGGLYAYSASCTHTGCTVPPPASASALSMCPCHGSRFDSNGVVQPGSVALRNLPHFALAVCDGMIVVDQFTMVPASTRWPV